MSGHMSHSPIKIAYLTEISGYSSIEPQIVSNFVRTNTTIEICWVMLCCDFRMNMHASLITPLGISACICFSSK